ncbi:MAG: hypothetical protein K1W14_06370 [Muribaculaceae bacterium]|jgi:hypothetical protein
MKTISQALKDEIHYPLGDGFIENRLLSRGLNGEEIITVEIMADKPFKGAVADCLMSLIEAPNFSESDIKIDVVYKDLILKRANRLYAAIGEEEKVISDQPKVRIGFPNTRYVRH